MYLPILWGNPVLPRHINWDQFLSDEATLQNRKQNYSIKTWRVFFEASPKFEVIQAELLDINKLYFLFFRDLSR